MARFKQFRSSKNKTKSKGKHERKEKLKDACLMAMKVIRRGESRFLFLIASFVLIPFSFFVSWVFYCLPFFRKIAHPRLKKFSM